METSLTEILAALELGGFQEALEQLGVTSRSDIGYLKDEDLKQVGLNLVQLRKLQAHVQVKDTQGYAQAPEPSRKRKLHEELGGLRWPHMLKPSPGLCTGFPRRFIFIRHGESEANVNRKLTATVPDHNLHLTERGRQQAIDAGQRLKALVGDGSLRFSYSPYVRARETLNGILHAWPKDSWPCHEDVRLREQEFGNYDPPDIKEQHKQKGDFGPFYYRFSAGESPADCYNRACGFLESFCQSLQGDATENQVIVSHGTMLVVLLMRIFQIPIHEFESIRCLQNAEFAVCERLEDHFEVYTWAAAAAQKSYESLRRTAATRELEIWNGDPNARLLSHSENAAA